MGAEKRIGRVQHACTRTHEDNEYAGVRVCASPVGVLDFVLTTSNSKLITSLCVLNGDSSSSNSAFSLLGN